MFAAMANNGVLAQTIFYGRTLSVAELKVVPLASILNANTGKKAISNRQGYFKIQGNEGDTLIITSIGLDSLFASAKTYGPAADTNLFFLHPKNVVLPEARILPGNSRRDSLARAAAEYLKTDPLLNNYSRVLDRQKGGIMNPLTALYQEFSKEGKDAARFDEFYAYLEKQKRVDNKLNPVFVERATGLPAYKQPAFKKFCNLDKDFVLTASDYDLIQALQKCANKYLQKP